MARSARKKTTDEVTTTADRSSPSRPHRSAHVSDSDIARVAYERYLARGCEPGQDIADWLQAERDLRDVKKSTAI
jgi:hypothetical protein